MPSTMAVVRTAGCKALQIISYSSSVLPKPSFSTSSVPSLLSPLLFLLIIATYNSPSLKVCLVVFMVHLQCYGHKAWDTWEGCRRSQKVLEWSWKVLEGLGTSWKVPEGFGTSWKVPEGFETSWKASEGLALESLGKSWKAPEGLRRSWKFMEFRLVI